MTALENCSVELKSQTKLCDDKVNGGLEKLVISYIPNINGTELPSISKETSTENDTRRGFLHYRYLIVLMEFLAFCQIGCLRQGTTVSIVAMVKTSNKIQVTQNFNYSESTCAHSHQDIQMDAVPVIEGEFDWSPSMQGYIISASYLGYVTTQMPGGKLAEAFGAKYTITFGLLISSVCHFISPFVSRVHINLMIFTQLVRGMGQGLFMAAHCVVAANWLPRDERGLLNPLVLAGFAFGFFIGGVGTGVISSTEALGGWSFSYYLFGGLGILLSFAFHFLFFETPRDHPKITEAELKYIEEGQETDMSEKRPATPWRKIFCSSPVYALVFSLCSLYWIGSYSQSVHSLFLGTILHFNIKENGVFSSVPFLLEMSFTLMTGWASNWLQRNEYASVDRLRKGFSFLCFFGFTLSFLGMYAAGCNRLLSVGFYILQLIANAFSFGGCLIVATDMSPRHAGSLMGLVSTISSTAQFILPAVVGFLTDDAQTFGQWNKVFFLSAGIAAAGAFAFCVFGSAEVQPWNFETKEEYDSYKATRENKNAKIEHLTNREDFISHL